MHLSVAGDHFHSDGNEASSFDERANDIGLGLMVGWGGVALSDEDKLNGVRGGGDFVGGRQFSGASVGVSHSGGDGALSADVEEVWIRGVLGFSESDSESEGCDHVVSLRILGVIVRRGGEQFQPGMRAGYRSNRCKFGSSRLRILAVLGHRGG